MRLTAQLDPLAPGVSAGGEGLSSVPGGVSIARRVLRYRDKDLKFPPAPAPGGPRTYRLADGSFLADSIKARGLPRFQVMRLVKVGIAPDMALVVVSDWLSKGSPARPRPVKLANGEHLWPVVRPLGEVAATQAYALVAVGWSADQALSFVKDSRRLRRELPVSCRFWLDPLDGSELPSARIPRAIGSEPASPL